MATETLQMQMLGSLSFKLSEMSHGQQSSRIKENRRQKLQVTAADATSHGLSENASVVVHVVVSVELPLIDIRLALSSHSG